jgi:micrococcal nuclease
MGARYDEPGRSVDGGAAIAPRPYARRVSTLRWSLAAGLALLIGAVLSSRLIGSGQPAELVPASAVPPSTGDASSLQARVVAVSDGDTIRLENGERVRYLGIDTPEMAGERTPEMAFAQEAARRNQDFVAGKTVRLERDAEDRDHFGRLLRHVWVGDNLVAAELLREGFGFYQLVSPNARYRDRLEAAQSEARATGRGLWSGWPTPAPVFLTPVRPSSLPLGKTIPAACPADVAAADQAGGLVGSAATVCLSDVRVERGSAAIFLKSATRGRAPQLTIVVFRDVMDRLSDSTVRTFERRTVVARGRIELYEDAPELIVRDPADIQLVP